MSCPRIDIDLRKIRHNTRTIADRLAHRGIGVTAVTKAACGHPAIARAMLDGGAKGLADARLSYVMRLRKAGITCPITLIRTPMLSQVDAVVKFCDASYNTEISVIAAIASAARRQGTVHGIILMVEMGDRREGILPHDLGAVAQQVTDMSGVALAGIGANFACLGGVAPTPAHMRALSDMADMVERLCGGNLRIVSGGNSANLPWAFEQRVTGRINDLRLGEAILLGVDPITGNQIGGLFRDAFTLCAEVIETDAPLVPAHMHCSAEGKDTHHHGRQATGYTRHILAIGQQDTDPAGLFLPAGTVLIGATSDHLVIGTKDGALGVGAVMRFAMTYTALMRAMAAPDVQIHLRNGQSMQTAPVANDPCNHLALV